MLFGWAVSTERSNGKIIVTFIRVPQRISVITGDAALLFFALAAFLSPFQVFSLNPVEAEMAGNAGAGINFSIIDFCLILSVCAIFLTSRKIRVPAHLPLGFYALFLLFASLSTLRAHNVAESYFHILQYLFIFIFIVTASNILSENEEKTLLIYKYFIAGCLLHLILSLYVYLTVGRFNIFQQALSLNDQFYGAGGLSRTGLVVAGFAIASIRMRFHQRRWARLMVSALICTFSMWLTVLTYNRATLIGLFVIIFVGTVLPVGGRLSFIRIGTRALVVLVILVVGIVVGADTVLPEHFIAKIMPVLMDPLSSDFMYRYSTMSAVVRSFEESAIIGYGMDFSNVVPGLSPYFEGPVNNPNPHNVYLLWWAGAGFIGMMLMIAAVGATIWQGYLGIKRSDSGSELRMIMIGALSVFAGFLSFYLVHGSSFRRIDWMVVGLLLACASVVRTRWYSQGGNVDAGKTRRIDGFR